MTLQTQFPTTFFKTYTPPAEPTPPVAAFTYEDNGDQSITFTDTSTNSPTSWSWEFDDGSIASTEQNPIHTYESAGPFTVTLTATNADGSDDSTQEVTVVLAPPIGYFVAADNGDLSVTFTDGSLPQATGTAIDTWSWDFGDGSAASTVQHPTHTYASANTYTVVLSITDTYGNADTHTEAVVVAAVARVGSGGLGTDINENWDAAGLPLTYANTVTVHPLSWSRALAIDNDGDSRVSPGTPLQTDEDVTGAYAGAEIIDFNGRKVLDLWCKGTAGRSVGAKVPLVVDNWKYEAFASYADSIAYIRYYTYVPQIHLEHTGGSWLTLGTQIKTTELYQSAGYQQNVERDFDNGGWRYWHKHLDPTGGANTTIKTTTTEPQPALQEAVWMQHDLEISMHATTGYIKQWIDGVLVFESTGIMGDDAGASLNAANFYVLIYGDYWDGVNEQHLYIGDVIVSPTPIDDGESFAISSQGSGGLGGNPPASTSLVQSAFRIRNDDGSETAATWRAAENTNINVPFGKYRARFQVRNTAVTDVLVDMRIQHNIDGAGWVNVPIDSTGYRVTGSDNMAFGDAVTAQLSNPGGTFATTVITELQTSGDRTIVAGGYAEYEFTLALFDWAGAASGIPYQLRLVQEDGTVLDTYTNTPTITTGGS